MLPTGSIDIEADSVVEEWYEKPAQLSDLTRTRLLNVSNMEGI